VALSLIVPLSCVMAAWPPRAVGRGLERRPRAAFQGRWRF
jgi:hypothetical protein